MDAVLTSVKTNVSVVISFNKKTIEDSEFYDEQYGIGLYNNTPVFEEYILSQVYRTGRFYNGYVLMSKRSVDKFKKWASENGVEGPYDFNYEF